VIGHQSSLAPFIIGIIILAIGAGFIKPSLGPLLCDQSPVQRPTLKTTSSGERVIVDPQATVQRYFLVFYWCINVGSFWMIVTSYTERLVGFWLAFLLPTAIYLVVPAVFLYARKRLYFAPPQGSVVLESFYVVKELFKRNGLKVFKGGESVWDAAKPSKILAADGHLDEKKIFWDDQFVEEIRQSINACSVSWVLVVFYLADGFIGNMENDQSAAMILNHIPNDIMSNL
jgi:POT family proton-dependent oligopeptide transporter